jgi:hypothetical protein
LNAEKEILSKLLADKDSQLHLNQTTMDQVLQELGTKTQEASEVFLLYVIICVNNFKTFLF